MDALKQRVSKAKLPIVAELGVSQLTVSEFLGLSVGDVISLNKPMHDGLSIKVGDKLKFIGSPGTIKTGLLYKSMKLSSKELKNLTSKDYLSQEEIDALLKQSEMASPASIPSAATVDDVLTPLEQDALGEIGNITFGSAATALSTLLGKKWISRPQSFDH